MTADSGRRRPGAQRAADGPEPSVHAALSRARSHGQAAITEALAATLALLDAASLASSGEPAHANAIFAPAARALDNLRSQITDPDREPVQLLQSVVSALDAEIARWEDRARDDADARSVLRAFLGVRELLWEFGIRSADPSSARPPKQPKQSAPRSGRRAKKVRHITVKG